ncbi:phosphoserine phosphatase SerB, partial [Rhizobium ruizarguesonis]
ANPSNPVLTPEISEQAAKAVNASGLYWLADGIACDIALRYGTDVQTAEANILAVISSAPIDLAIQEQETRRKKLLIADMDST